MERRAFEGMVPATGVRDLARDVLPSMLDAGRRLYGYVSPEYIKDVGTPDRLDQVERDITAGIPDRLCGRSMRSAVFLDRDGTINREVHYLDRPDRIHQSAIHARALEHGVREQDQDAAHLLVGTSATVSVSTDRPAD